MLDMLARQHRLYLPGILQNTRAVYVALHCWTADDLVLILPLSSSFTGWFTDSQVVNLQDPQCPDTRTWSRVLVRRRASLS